MEAFLYADARQCKQSGTEEEFKEKQLLLESLREKFSEREVSKQAAIEARRKEKKNEESGGKLQQDALETLKLKRSRQDEHGPPDKKGKFNLEKIWQQKQKLKESELMLREKELELRERELALQEKKAKQIDETQKQSVALMNQMQALMQQQTQ